MVHCHWPRIRYWQQEGLPKNLEEHFFLATLVWTLTPAYCRLDMCKTIWKKITLKWCAPKLARMITIFRLATANHPADHMCKQIYLHLRRYRSVPRGVNGPLTSAKMEGKNEMVDHNINAEVSQGRSIHPQAPLLSIFWQRLHHIRLSQLHYVFSNTNSQG